MKVFLSYTRLDEAATTSVAEAIESLSHSVWYDHAVAGGQPWWDAILKEIRAADLFVFVLTVNSQKSKACKAEYTYASQLHKRILPILCDENVRVNLLPAELSKIQFVPYLTHDLKTGLALANAINQLPPAMPLPDPLPTPPPVPLSYLSGLCVQIEADRELTPAEQSALRLDLKQGLEDDDSREDALTLLRILRRRQDLLAVIRDEIDDVLKAYPDKPVEKRTDETDVRSHAAQRQGAERQQKHAKDDDAQSCREPIATMSRDTSEAELGRIVGGKIVELQSKGCVIELRNGERGFCSLKNLAEPAPKSCEEVVSVGDSVPVKVIGRDAEGRVKLDRKSALPEFLEMTMKEASELLGEQLSEQDAANFGEMRMKEFAEAQAPASAPALTFDVGSDQERLEEFVKAVAATSDIWVMKAGTSAMSSCDEMLSIAVEDKHLAVHATFKRWSRTLGNAFQAKGWVKAGGGTKAAAGAALGAFGYLTAGLGFALLLHRGTRDYLLKQTEFLKTFPLPLRSPTKVAAAIIDAFELLCPDATTVIALRADAQQAG
jgi:predicted RNA-binding protein with RPS1 domain